jgi:hypothetical protein
MKYQRAKSHAGRHKQAVAHLHPDGLKRLVVAVHFLLMTARIMIHLRD